MQSLRDELELRRKTEVHEIEEVSTSMTVYMSHMHDVLFGIHSSARTARLTL